jgi:hypothetical protein
MSYHILHQFDEQWLADNGTDKDQQPGGFFDAFGPEHKQALSRSSPRRQWLIVITSLLIAASALYFALDARRQADTLQQRLVEMEITLKK